MSAGVDWDGLAGELQAMSQEHGPDTVENTLLAALALLQAARAGDGTLFTEIACTFTRGGPGAWRGLLMALVKIANNAITDLAEATGTPATPYLHAARDDILGAGVT